jgi:hypothetical protein
MDMQAAVNLESDEATLDKLRARVYAAKIAYLNRTPFGEAEELTYEDLKSIAEAFIKASYEVQKKRYGRIRVRISVAKLLRSR